jgi:nicotinamidase-related amidase
MCTVLFLPASIRELEKKEEITGRTPQIRLQDEATGNSDTSAAALLLIDVINDLDFEGADELLRQGMPMARRLVLLKCKASRAQIPIIYVNDNFGHWKSDFSRTVEHCCSGNSRGAEISRMLRPAESDYFVLKPKHSGFYATTLDLLLEYLKVNTLILTGIAANICVLFTANDAYMRDYKLFVPSDCVASNTAEETEYSLRQMRNILKAEIRESTEIGLGALSAATPHRGGSGANKLIKTK